MRDDIPATPQAYPRTQGLPTHVSTATTTIPITQSTLPTEFPAPWHPHRKAYSLSTVPIPPFPPIPPARPRLDPVTPTACPPLPCPPGLCLPNAPYRPRAAYPVPARARLRPPEIRPTPLRHSACVWSPVSVYPVQRNTYLSSSSVIAERLSNVVHQPLTVYHGPRRCITAASAHPDLRRGLCPLRAARRSLADNEFLPIPPNAKVLPACAAPIHTHAHPPPPPGHLHPRPSPPAPISTRHTIHPIPPSSHLAPRISHLAPTHMRTNRVTLLLLFPVPFLPSSKLDAG
ncbi:hypothetical protein B0H17DRAFT_1191817 [Mycena rosella]|uniref:Uncharacterized protein n=1 Tax=Mycena rosella TaxID=1033263 RepID=A0AAD7GZK4_MYCRO|nr:hypothetical protein B0H17DRAFT_1191817 [Mycena rosella]